jgi:hypothetical protein
MPKFQWVGETPRSWVESYGPTTEFRVVKKNGTRRSCIPDDPVAGFQLDEVLKDEAREEINFQDPTSVRALSVDPRVAEVAP